MNSWYYYKLSVASTIAIALWYTLMTDVGVIC